MPVNVFLEYIRTAKTLTGIEVSDRFLKTDPRSGICRLVRLRQHPTR